MEDQSGSDRVAEQIRTGSDAGRTGRKNRAGAGRNRTVSGSKHRRGFPAPAGSRKRRQRDHAGGTDPGSEKYDRAAGQPHFSGTAAGYVGAGRTPPDLSKVCGRKDAVRGGKAPWNHAGSDFAEGKETACEIAKYGIKCDTVPLIDKNVQ